MYKWTKEPPTEPGWYWMRPDKRDFFGCRIVYVREYGEEMCIDNWKVPNNAEWAGPIPEPEE